MNLEIFIWVKGMILINSQILNLWLVPEMGTSQISDLTLKVDSW